MHNGMDDNVFREVKGRNPCHPVHRRDAWEQNDNRSDHAGEMLEFAEGVTH